MNPFLPYTVEESPEMKAEMNNPTSSLYRYRIADLISGKNNEKWDYLTPEQKRVVMILRNNQGLANDIPVIDNFLMHYYRNKKADKLSNELLPNIPINYFVSDPDSKKRKKGYYEPYNRRIFIRNDLKGTDRATTLIHEIAHWLQDDLNNSVNNELDADSTANLIIKHHPAYERSPEIIKEYYDDDIPYLPNYIF